MNNNETPLNILVVDDDEDGCTALKHIIESHGHRVDIALNGLQAVKTVEKSYYDYIIMDIDLPWVNGLEATRLIKIIMQNTNNSVTNIIGISGHTGKKIENECIEAGMVGYIQKPIVISDLVSYFLNNTKPNLDSKEI